MRIRHVNSCEAGESHSKVVTDIDIIPIFEVRKLRLNKVKRVKSTQIAEAGVNPGIPLKRDG